LNGGAAIERGGNREFAVVARRVVRQLVGKIAGK
jgi:hypothetical protein